MAAQLSARVPISEEDKEKSIYKYYEMDLTPVPKERYDFLAKGPLAPAMALSIQDRNDLFKPGYLAEEVGYCTMVDGTGYLANLTPMPGVTTEMFDWWFAWHGLDKFRYTVWNPEDHFYANCMQKSRALDPALSFKERYWNTTHHVVENIGFGPEGIYINFKYPGDMGYDVSKLGTAACSTIVCANGYGETKPPFGSAPAVMTHFVREVEGGIELRTRFWMGWKIVEGQAVKVLPDGMRMPEFGALNLLLHNIKEFTHLAKILPELFASEKDNF